MNSIWKKLIQQFVANFKGFETVADAKGEIVAFAMVTGLEEVKEKRYQELKFHSEKWQK